jgi:hypothetical protein
MISKVAAVALAMCHAASANIGEYWKQLSTPVYEVEGWSVKDATMARAEDGTYAIFYSGFYTAPRDEYASCRMQDALDAEFRDLTIAIFGLMFSFLTNGLSEAFEQTAAHGSFRFTFVEVAWL